MPEQRDLVAALAQVINLVNRRLATVVETARVTPQQWGVLSVIGSSKDAMTLAAVARELAVTKQNMTGMVDRLEQLGLVERLTDPADLRSSRLQLTRRGRAALDKVAPAYEAWLRSLGSDRDIQALTRSLNRLIERLEES